MVLHARNAWLRRETAWAILHAMQTARWWARIYFGISLSLSACSSTDPRRTSEAAGGAADAATAGASSEVPGESAGEAGTAGTPLTDNPGTLQVVQVETLTTVQSSAGSFLTPTPEQALPAYVERGADTSSAQFAEAQGRAKVDIALLFRGGASDPLERALAAQLSSPVAAPWSAIEHCFPHVVQAAANVSWPLVVSRAADAQLDSSVSAEWRGWQDFRGLGVRGGVGQAGPSAPVATLDFETVGLSSPLVLSVAGSDLVVTNRSTHAIARALLIYSHSGGVGVTALASLAPGESRVTLLGPKEHPADVLLELARAQLSDFFSTSVAPELASAMAAAKSIPFLETQGLRLVALLDDDQAPVAASFSAAVSAQQRVVVSHSEILKPEEEARVLGAVKDADIDAEQALSSFGRFTRAKLEFAAQSADSAVSARATALLAELRAR